MTIALDNGQLEILLLQLNPSALDCRAKIVRLRRLMDEACDQRIINMSQWRSLLERISIVQGKHVQYEPDGWRYPAISEDCATKPKQAPEGST
jgi:hypothetical protein